MLNFLRQIELFHVVKLFGAVDGQRIREAPCTCGQHANRGNRPPKMGMQVVQTAAPHPLPQKECLTQIKQGIEAVSYVPADESQRSVQSTQADSRLTKKKECHDAQDLPD